MLLRQLGVPPLYFYKGCGSPLLSSWRLGIFSFILLSARGPLLVSLMTWSSSSVFPRISLILHPPKNLGSLSHFLEVWGFLLCFPEGWVFPPLSFWDLGVTLFIFLMNSGFFVWLVCFCACPIFWFLFLFYLTRARHSPSCIWQLEVYLIVFLRAWGFFLSPLEDWVSSPLLFWGHNFTTPSFSRLVFSSLCSF